jgi:hypothetical protein
MMTERERESKIEELRSRIAELEAIINRTPQQEQELQDKKQELVELEKQQQKGGFKKYLPWIIGGGIVLIVAIGAIAYFTLRKKEPKKYDKDYEK